MVNGKFRILAINPGSTSTKASLFEDETSVFERSLFHDSSVLLKFPHVNDQMPFRRQVILDMLKDEGVERISSQELSERMNVTASQIRQDFNNFGGSMPFPPPKPPPLRPPPKPPTLTTTGGAFSKGLALSSPEPLLPL